MRAAPADFGLLLPPEWVRIPIDARAPELVSRIVNARVQALPGGQRDGARRTLTRELTEALQAAADAGGIDVFLSLAERDGLPLAASCLVTHLSGRDAVPLEALAAELTSGDAEIDLVRVADAPAVRRRHTTTVSSEAGSAVSTEVDFFVPIPDSNGMIVLSFATGVEALTEALVTLFDAMAETLRWIRP